MGATTVLAKAPAHAPARASLAAVLGFFNLDSIIGGGVSFPCGGDGGVSGCGGCVGADATLMMSAILIVCFLLFGDGKKKESAREATKRAGTAGIRKKREAERVSKKDSAACACFHLLLLAFACLCLCIAPYRWNDLG